MSRFSDELIALRGADFLGDTSVSKKLLQFYNSLTDVMYKWKNSDDPDDVERRQKVLIEGYELVPNAKVALFIACTYAILENQEKTFEWLEKSYGLIQTDKMLAHVHDQIVDAEILEPYRDSPMYTNLVSRMEQDMEQRGIPLNVSKKRGL
jgi:hypothetical protein